MQLWVFSPYSTARTVQLYGCIISLGRHEFLVCPSPYRWHSPNRSDSKFKKSEFKTLFRLWNTTCILFLECGNFCIYLSIFELLLRRILNFWTIDINWIVLVDEFYCSSMSWIAPKPVIAKVFYLILLMECVVVF